MATTTGLPAAADSRQQGAIRHRFRWLSDRRLATAFILPTLILLIFISIFPLIWSLYLSFTDYSAIDDVAPNWVGLDNYYEMLTRDRVWERFGVTAKFMLMAVPVEFGLGFLLAILLNRNFRGRGLIMTLMLMPMMLSPIVVGLFWKFIYRADIGVINYYVTQVFNLAPIDWLNDIDIALISIAIVDVWMWTPFMMLILLAGLSAIPRYLYEAAEVDRAGAWFRFRHITLPLVWPLALIALLFRVIDSYKLFDQVFILTGGTPGGATEVVSMYLYNIGFRRFDTGEASALGYIMLIVIIALSNILIRALNRAKAG